jgi:hypothetical protein
VCGAAHSMHGAPPACENICSAHTALWVIDGVTIGES